MAKNKIIKTNAMRILDKNKVKYTVNTYECDEFIDGITIADKLHQSYEESFKTLVTVGKSKEHYVFVIPIHKELDLKKAAQAVGEKSIEMLPVKSIKDVTGYIRGGCTPIGMKKQFVTVIHKSVMEHDTIIISGGCIGAQILLMPNDLINTTNGKVEDIIM